MDHRTDSPQLLLDFLSYHETIKAHSKHTVDEYYLDMRNFSATLSSPAIRHWLTSGWTRSASTMWTCRLSRPSR